MKLILLTQGKHAIVDDKDYEFIMQWKWCFHKGYAVRTLKGSHIYMHRVINATSAGYETDHINMDKLDNRKENLRTVTRSQNNTNRLPKKNASSRFKGVYFEKKRGLWIAQIKPVGKAKIYLGGFTSEEAAAQAYNIAAMTNGVLRLNDGGVLSAGKH